MPALQGTYFYADFAAGFCEEFPLSGMVKPRTKPSGHCSIHRRSITSFGEDALGELYLMTQGGGLFKIVPN